MRAISPGKESSEGRRCFPLPSLQAPSRTRALERCIEAYQLYPDLPDAKAALENLKALHARLTDTSSSRSSQASQKRMDTQALQALRSGWAEHYSATRLIVRGLLKRAGRESEWKGLFMDA